MKVVKFLGGLGNQMFQYAFLLSLKRIYKESILMDVTIFETYGLHNGFELDQVFNITATKATIDDIKKVTYYTQSYFKYRIYRKFFPQRKTEFREKHFYEFYPDVLKGEGYSYFDGYWQYFKYFDSCKENIKKEFSYKEDLDEKNQKIEDFLLENNNCVSIHVRRGDYLKHKLYRGLCGLDYYVKSIQMIRKQYPNVGKWLIFSNDISWCKDNLLSLLEGENVIFVDWNVGKDSYKDMRLMSDCRINILANSSFSWWAAYLNKHENSIVYAPNKWVNLPMKFKIQMPNWILI